MIALPLHGKGDLVALIDDEDEWLMEWKWYVLRGTTTNYAIRSAWSGRWNMSTSLMMHREIMSAPVHMEVDHRNGNGLDNRTENLRLATRAQNARNRRIQSNNTSGIRGVDWRKREQKWRARIKVDNTYIELGHFTDLEEAKVVREEAALYYYGEFARK